MDAEKGRFYRANVWTQYNGVGAILTVLMGCVVAVTNSSMDGKPVPTAGMSSEGRAIMDVFLIAPCVLMTLYQVRVDLDADRREGRVGRGLWPFLRWRNVSLAGPSELRLSADRGRNGWSFNARLVFTGTRRSVPLTLAGTSDELQEVARWTRRLGARTVATPHFLRSTPAAIRQKAPEAFEEAI